MDEKKTRRKKVGKMSQILPRVDLPVRAIKEMPSKRNKTPVGRI